MSQSTWYRGDSIRVKQTGYAGNLGQRFGKFAAELRETIIRVIRSDDPMAEEPFGCIVGHGSQCRGYATEAKALAAGERWMEANGWTQDRALAESEAVYKALKRHEAQNAKSSNYAKHYE